MNIKFYFPRWFFPNNIGDSVNTTFIPKILKKIYPNSHLEVITQGFLIDLFKLDPNVDIVREPNNEERYLNFREYSISENQKENIKIIYTEWHPKVFDFWGNHHDFLVSHPTVNLITLNYLLQLKMENLIFDREFDFSEIFYVNENKNVSEKINIGIVPATKLAGRPTPHPGCDGKGLRFNGENGVQSWFKFVNKLKELNENVCIYEFSNENFGLGDFHYPHTNNFLELISQVDNIDLGIMSDGGIHHVFNARKKPVVLFQATKVNKCEFFKLENSFFPENLHLECRKKCRSYFSEVLKIDDMSKTCSLECENLDPIKLAIYTNNIINNNIIKNK
jgi:hypothetical protein